MNDPFGKVREASGRGGEVLGAPDFLDRDKQLELALEQIAALHKEVARLLRVASTAVHESREAVAAATQVAHGVARTGPAKADRRSSARKRRKDGTLSFVRYLRTRAWIEFRSSRAARTEAFKALEALERRVDRPDPTSPFAGDMPIREFLRTADYDRGHVLARALLPNHGRNPRFLQLLQKVETARGSVSVVLAVARALNGSSRPTRAAVRRIEGRLREISGWYPRLPGQVDPVDPVDESTVLHLVKESRPYLSNGFTSRSHRNFIAELGAGLRPIVLTEPGFPRCVGAEEVSPTELVDGIEHRRIDSPAFTAEMPFDTYLQVFAQEALRVVQEVRPAVLHASSGRRGYETALVALALAEKTGLPFVYEVRSFFESLWTADTQWEEKGETFLRRTAVEQMCLDRADVVLTLGDAMRDELVRRGADPAKIRLIPNGVDLGAFPRGQEHAGLATELGIGDRPTFGYVSNLDHPRESQETLVRTAAELTKRGLDVRCVLVGGGARTGIVERLARELGVRDRVVLTGPVDHTEIARYYALIDVFVVPRIDERAARFVTPLKPFEAMALARPLVVSDLPALREIAEPPSRGLTFAPGDHVALADVIAGLFADPKRAAEIGEAGYRWVRQERQWTMNGKRYADAFTAARERHQRAR